MWMWKAEQAYSHLHNCLVLQNILQGPSELQAMGVLEADLSVSLSLSMSLFLCLSVSLSILSFSVSVSLCLSLSLTQPQFSGKAKAL